MSAPKKITLPDGRTRYRVVYDAGRDPETGKRRQITKTFDRKKDADAELARVRHQRATGAYVPPSKLTVNGLLDSHQAAVQLRREAATLSNYAHAVKPARAFFGERLAQSITREDVQALVGWMMTAARKRGGTPGTGLGPRSVRLCVSRLSAAYDLAVDDGKVTRNPCRRVELPALAPRPKVTWSADEARAFLAVASSDRLHAAWRMALTCGMRREEICGLRWENVDLKAHSLAISTCRVVVDGAIILKDTPKSDRGARVLPIDDAMHAALTALHKRQAAERLAAGPAYEAGLAAVRWYRQAPDGSRTEISATPGYVVTDELGIPVSPEWLSDEFERLGKRAELPRITLHEARHTLNSLMAARGVPLHIRSAYCGHTEDVNERTYTHARPEDLASAGATASDIFKIAGG